MIFNNSDILYKINMKKIDDLSEKIIRESEKILYEEESGLPGEVLEILLNTREQCEMTEKLIKNQIEVKDEMINKLYNELEYYKKESANRFIGQFIKSFIKVRKDMSRMLSGEKWAEMSVEDIKREYTYIFEDITDLLEQQNVEAYRSQPGDNFNPSIHQPKIEETKDPTLEKKIKESLDDGYIKGGKVWIVERVIVFKYKEQIEKENI